MPWVSSGTPVAKSMVLFTVKLNGTSVNPYAIYGMTQNPFPQRGEYKYSALCRLLNNLAAEPIKDTDELRRRMQGADQDFIDGCCERFRPGKMVSFEIEFPAS